MPKPKIDLAEVREMLNAGVPRKHIMEVSGIGKTAPSNFATAWGIVAKRGQPRKKALTAT